MNKGRILLLSLASFLMLGLVSIIFDREINLFIYAIRSPFLDSLFNFLSLAQIPGTIGGLLILIIAILFFTKKEKIAWIIEMLLTFVLTYGITFLIKELTDRARPYIVLGLQKPLIDALGSSFPSTHAAILFSMLPFFEEEYPRAKYLWIAFAIIVCFVRIYLQVHYVSDIIFGAIIGYSIGFLLTKTDKRIIDKLIHKRNKKER